MSDASWKREVELACGRWLDVDSIEPGDDVAPPAEADAESRRRTADHQFVDALLHSLAGDGLSDSSARVRRVMAAIEVERQAPLAARRITGVMSFVGLAAGLLIACTLLVIKSANESRANEALTAIREVSLTDADRLYRVLHSAAGRNRPLEFLGKLYLRGTTGFALQTGEVVFGRHGNEYWMVPSHGPVIVADDFGWLRSSSGNEIEVALLKELSLASRRTPLMQLSSIVDLVQDDYDVKMQRAPEDDLHGLDELVATRRPADAELPATIRLTFDRETKIVHRVELTWNAGHSESPRQEMHFVLAPTESVTDRWYHHAAHHAAGRPVRRATAESTADPSPASDKEF